MSRGPMYFSKSLGILDVIRVICGPQHLKGLKGVPFSDTGIRREILYSSHIFKSIFFLDNVGQRQQQRQKVEKRR